MKKQTVVYMFYYLDVHYVGTMKMVGQLCRANVLTAFCTMQASAFNVCFL